ncbi:Tigger transposable element-derived protein 3 [Cichlidogyrus casuarinus]|uniref:Tigger transposable element-derived protein 3 n=1 Tax=Cichlidogyrus casuarinus TaxID=1844966 RepID=A0ABD2Q946_9PLAT
MSQRKIAEKYKCSKGTVAYMKKMRDEMEWKLCDAPDKSNDRKYFLRNLKFSRIDREMAGWFRKQIQKRVPLLDAQLMIEAESLAAAYGETEFKASQGWLTRSKKRHGILSKKAQG